MTLHGQAVLPPKLAERVHQIVGTRRDEARRQDGLRFFEFLRRLEPRDRIPHGLILRDLAQINRAVAVHVDLADVGAQAALLQQLHQVQRRRHMDGGKNTGAGGRAVDKVTHKALIRAVCIFQIPVF